MKRNTLILILLAALLGGAVYYFEKDGTTRDEEKDTSVAAFAFKPEDIVLVSMNNGGKIVAAEKQNNAWTMVQPFVTEADQDTVSSIVEDMSKVKLKRTLKAPNNDLAPFGLSPAKTTVEFKSKTGQSYRILIGDKDPTGDSVYVKVDPMTDIGLVAVPATLLAQKEFNDFRERRFLTIKPEDVTKVRIKNPNLTLVAEKNSEGKWLVKEPANKKDKEVPADKIADNWVNTVSQEVIDQPSAEIQAKLAKPAVEATITTKDNKDIVVKFSALDGDKCYVKIEGQPKAWRIRKDEFEEMTFKLTDLIPEPTPTPAAEASASPSPAASPANKAAKKK